MAKMLLVEDSRLFGSVVKKRIEANSHFDVTWTQTMSDAITYVEESEESYLFAILDLNLPDAPNGEIIDEMLARGIPGIISTASFSEDLRREIWAKRIIDYVLKESSHAVDYMVRLVNRIWSNQSVDILVVDDFKTTRMYVSQLLETHYYQVSTAGNGQEALEVLEQNPNISVVIADYHMPVMDGFGLIDKIRQKHSREDLAIIGMSSQESDMLTARFLKMGANDFLTKPFSSEEFYCRVAQNVEMIDYIRQLKGVERIPDMINL